MAVIVPIEDYQKWQRLAKTRFFEMLKQVRERNANAPPEELAVSSKDLIRGGHD